jgi:phytoene/squalene synthetase
MIKLFNQVSAKAAKMITQKYSTSFSLGISLLDKELQQHIYNIYGFVRFADEIVDTFHEYDQEKLLKEFRIDTYKALDRGISLNPVLHAFQITVNKYNISRDLIDCFLNSMEMDLHKLDYDYKTFKQYILGSAEVVGLMCLKIFCLADEKLYNDLTPNAMSLGSAFQKINFLRDLKQDFKDMGRSYFPEVDLENFDQSSKTMIENDIAKDFAHAMEGIKKLPKSSRIGVYTAYVYYYKLFQKIVNTPPEKVLKERIRIPDAQKMYLLVGTYMRHNINML